ncbi:MAG: hypothetical protein RKO24_08805 [Candidatus Competibacter sp.]|nr:hypothetical protein [Candidatus Competibacter sp.]
MNRFAIEAVASAGRACRGGGWSLALAALGGAVLTVLGFVLYYLDGGLMVAYPSLRWGGEQMTVVRGQGQPTADGLEIRPAGSDDTIIVWFSTRKGFMARPYGKLAWNIEGLGPARDARLIWRVQSDPNQIRQVALHFADLEKAQFDLRARPGWEGYVVDVGLRVRGAFAQPLRVRQVELLPQALSAEALLRQAWEEWSTSEYWSQRSAHYISGAPRRALFHPVVVVAVWIGLSVLLYGFWLWPTQQRIFRFGPFAALFLVGWWVLDLRWQADLAQRSLRTYERFAGKDDIAKRIAADDGDLFRFLLDVRRYLPSQPARVFIVNDDAANRAVARNYMVARARYHLQPHNGFADISDWSQLAGARPGDYLLVLRPDKGQRSWRASLRFDPERRLMLWESGQLPVQPVYSAAMGELFRVGEP